MASRAGALLCNLLAAVHPMIAAKLLGLRRVAVLQIDGDSRPLHIAAQADTAVGRPHAAAEARNLARLAARAMASPRDLKVLAR